MNSTRPSIDLSTFDRPEDARIPQPRRSLIGLVVPIAIMLAFGAILWWSAGSLFIKAKPVSIVRPQLAEHRASGGEVTLQAAGWIEPDPFPSQVVALARGVVEELLVQESDLVEKGQVIARLIADDARLALNRLTADLAAARATFTRVQAEYDTAQRSFEEKVVLTEALEVATARAGGKRAEVIHRERQIEKSKVDIAVAEAKIGVQKFLEKAGADGPFQVEIARLEAVAARAQLAIDRADRDLAIKEAEEAEAGLRRAQRDLELRLEDGLRVAKARAECDAAKARVAMAQSARDEGQLRLDRMEVRAPMKGIVLRRLAMPGSIVGMADNAVPLLSLFEPKSLRLRVDVPQTRIDRVIVGQDVLIESQARNGRPYRGKVSRLVQESDIQKVTLQVHIVIEDADAILRPEMLCTARFIAPKRPQSDTETKSNRIVLLPERLVSDSHVWVIAGDGRSAEKRSVTLGERRGENVEILEGLDLSAKIIDRGRDTLSPGDPITLEETR